MMFFCCVCPFICCECIPWFRWSRQFTAVIINTQRLSSPVLSSISNRNIVDVVKSKVKCCQSHMPVIGSTATLHHCALQLSRHRVLLISINKWCSEITNEIELPLNVTSHVVHSQLYFLLYMTYICMDTWNIYCQSTSNEIVTHGETKQSPRQRCVNI
jgi:hypothetical protein